MNHLIGAISKWKSFLCRIKEIKRLKKHLMLNFYENGSDYTQTTRSFCPNVEIFKKILNK